MWGGLQLAGRTRVVLLGRPPAYRCQHVSAAPLQRRHLRQADRSYVLVVDHTVLENEDGEVVAGSDASKVGILGMDDCLSDLVFLTLQKRALLQIMRP